MLLEMLSSQTVEEAAKSVEQSAGLVKETMDKMTSWLVSKSGSLLVALLFIAIGLKIVSLLLKVIRHSFERSKLEASVAGFLLSILRVVGYTLVFITAATIVGFEVTSFVTILGTASLAVGLALQGALSNLAGGVLILLLKPFQVGDYIVEDTKKNEGTVVSIDIFYTRLRTIDNKLVVIPNGVLAAASLMNLTYQDKRKTEIKICVSYATDMELVKKTVEEVLVKNHLVLHEDGHDIFIDTFDDSGMTLGIRAWVATSDFWQATWELREQIKAAFDRNGIEIPYSRLEVTMLNHE